MKAVVATFNQEKALVGAFSVITNLRMELFEALLCTGVILSYLLLLQVLHMWDWAGPDLLSKVTLDTAAISGVAFHPFDNNLVITHGRGHLAFWNRWMCRYLLDIYTLSIQYLYNINASQKEGRVLLPG